MTYRESLDYLNSFIDHEQKSAYDYTSFKLDRMVRLAAALGDPHKEVRSIHVAGTKGKGSTSAIIHSILRSSGLKAGLYTSPHLVSFRERIRINDTLISEESVGSLMDRIREAVDTMAEDRPTFFEIYTALAFLYFKKKKADIAVYEVGLGGRLDATNIIEPLVSVITPISYEHTDILGATLAAIAGEKAGIIKEGSVCVSAPQEKEALAVIEARCEEKESGLILAGREIRFEELKATDEREVFSVAGLFGQYKDLHMKLLGAHQVVNAAVAIAAVETLRFSGMTISPEAIRKGVEEAKWPGRLELIKGSPRFLLDGAQNQASAHALALAVKRQFKYRKLIIILGVSKDKGIKGILKELVPIADAIILTRSRLVERAMDPAMIKQLITPKDKDVTVTDRTGDALVHARRKAAPQDLVLVTGSLFIVGEAREILMKDNPDA
jgi:dihydrofolate synthase/folylpolyglutamate synthase